ncbi:MAG TPA: hypothetical protein ENG80_06415 [Nitrospirae bacterium]|nr:hypothetical protein [Nitrospirota bacterium]
MPLDSISSVVAGSKKFVPENIDGIRFVEKISAQHGSFVPGLGDEEEYVTLSLKLSDGTERIIYAVRTDDEPDIPLKQIQRFLGIT